MLNLVCMGFRMIDQELLDKNERLLNAIALGDLTLQEAAIDLMELLGETNGNYIKLIEQNAELHKENEKNKSDANKLYELCADSGVCAEFLKVNFAN